MARKNRKVKKQGHFGKAGVLIATNIVFAVIMAVVYVLFDTSICSLKSDLNELDRQEKRLEDQYTREHARWEEMHTPEKLNQQLARFGLDMNYHRNDQIIRIDSHGRVHAGQFAARRARTKSKIVRN